MTVQKTTKVILISENYNTLLCSTLPNEHNRLLAMQRKRTSTVWRKMTDRQHLHEMFKVNIIEWNTHTLCAS